LIEGIEKDRWLWCSQGLLKLSKYTLAR